VKYGDYEYPKWADAVGWVIGVFPVCIIIGVGAYKVSTAPEGPLSEVRQHNVQLIYDKNYIIQ
jgi:hypothetical protein